MTRRPPPDGPRGTDDASPAGPAAGRARTSPARVAPRVLVTHDADRATAALGRLLTLDRLDVGRPSPDFTFRMVTGTSGALTVATVHLGAEGVAEATPAAGAAAGALVTSVMLSRGAVFAPPGQHPSRLRAGEVWRLDAGEGLRVAYDAGATFAALTLPLSAVADAAGGAAAEGPDGRPQVHFLAHRPVDEEAESYWAALTRATAQQVTGPGGAPVSPLLREHQVRTLAAAALVVFATAPVDHLRGPGFTGPATVRRALEHLHAHAGQPLTVSDLAAAAGVGVRALQHGFLRHLGTTPTAHLQQVRLERAHADLVAGDPTAGDSVAAVAARWGFAHLGRFAAAHRARYGVLPSVTLRG